MLQASFFMFFHAKQLKTQDPRKLGNDERILKLCGTQTSIKSTLKKSFFGTVQTYEKADIKVFWFCPFLLHLLTFCQIFYPGLSKETNLNILLKVCSLNFAEVSERFLSTFYTFFGLNTNKLGVTRLFLGLKLNKLCILRLALTYICFNF